jgi:hypothetical protein
MGEDFASDKLGIREIFSFDEFREMRQRVEDLT